MTSRKIYNVLQWREVANEKYVIFPKQRPPSQRINYFLGCLSERFDFYSKNYGSICILGDFNLTPSNSLLTKARN